MNSYDQCQCGKRKTKSSRLCQSCRVLIRRNDPKIEQVRFNVARCMIELRLSQKEIAARLGMTPQNVNYHWRVALEKIKQLARMPQGES